MYTIKYIKSIFLIYVVYPKKRRKQYNVELKINVYFSPFHMSFKTTFFAKTISTVSTGKWSIS